MAPPDSPPKRPRLSLQIKAISNGPSVRTSRALAAAVNPGSPTSFNTLSNVYVTAIGRSTSEPLTAINTTRGQPLMLQTQTPLPAPNTHSQTPFAGSALPDTPLTAQPLSPAVYGGFIFPSTMTATPPLSAGPLDSAVDHKIFTFSVQDTSRTPVHMATDAASGFHSADIFPCPQASPRGPPRRRTAPVLGRNAAPYTHPRSLHSILRNSPLPERSPVSPRRQSLRLQEKAARRVGYNSPLTQTITTRTYTRSHIDLLCEDASPLSPATESAGAGTDLTLDTAMAYTSHETRDGGQTPGPFEEMRWRMAGLAAASPLSSPSGGVRKRKRKESKRRWVWTIGEDEEDATREDAIRRRSSTVSATPGLVASPTDAATPRPRLSPASSDLRAAQPTAIPTLTINTMATPFAADASEEAITPSIESCDTSQASSSCDAATDAEMSDISSVSSDFYGRGLTPGDAEYDMITPTISRKRRCSARLASEDLIYIDAGMRRDTPIPDELICP